MFYNNTVNFGSPTLTGLFKHFTTIFGKNPRKPIPDDGYSHNNHESAVSKPQKPSADVKPNVAHIIRRHTSADNNNVWKTLYADFQESDVSEPQKPVDNKDTWKNIYADVWRSMHSSNNTAIKKAAKTDEWGSIWKGNYSRRSFNYSRVLLI